MTAVFHVRPYGRFIEILGNLKRKKLQRTNQGSNICGGSFSNRDNVRAQYTLEEKDNSSILKDYFSSRTDQSIFTSIASVSLDQSNKTSWVFPLLNQQATSCLSPKCLIDQIHVEKPILVAVQIRYLITLTVESSIISIDSKVIDV